MLCRLIENTAIHTDTSRHSWAGEQSCWNADESEAGGGSGKDFLDGGIGSEMFRYVMCSRGRIDSAKVEGARESKREAEYFIVSKTM